jgi:hypothetical protein
MAIHPNGAPYVPENCPQHVEGATIPDLREGDFHVAVHTTYNRPEPIIEASASFIVGDTEADDPYSRVDAGWIIESPRSPLGQQLLRFANIAEATSAAVAIAPQGNPQAEQIRQILCDRTATCHGMIRGECWALGETGLRKMLAEVLQPGSET